MSDRLRLSAFFVFITNNYAIQYSPVMFNNQKGLNKVRKRTYLRLSDLGFVTTRTILTVCLPNADLSELSESVTFIRVRIVRPKCTSTVIFQNKTPQNKTTFEILGKTALAKIRPLSYLSQNFSTKVINFRVFLSIFEMKNNHF